MRIIVVLLALCTAAALYISTRPISSFETEVVKAEMAESGPQAQAALAQYPLASQRVFAIYGQTPEFVEILRKYGHNQTVPIIEKCFQGGDAFLEAGGWFEQAANSLWNWKLPENKKLTPEECGWRAILLTYTIGNDFLGQFVIDDIGQANRLPGSSVLATIKNLTVGNLQVLERKLVLGESPSWQEWGQALLDVAVIGAAGKSVSLIVRSRLAAQAVKPALGARVAAARGGLTGFAKAAAPRLSAKVAARAAKYTVIAGVAYVAIYHPALITAAAKALAEIIGWDPVLVQFLFWMVILAVPLWFLYTVWRVVSLPFRWAKKIA